MKKAKQNIISKVGDHSADLELEEELKTPIEKPSAKNAEKSPKQRLAFLRDERFKKVCGLVLLSGSVFMLFAFGSFVFNWQVDQNIAKGMRWSVFVQADNETAVNMLGKLGAWVAYVFLYKGFGIASFAFVLVFALLGIKLLTDTTPLPIFKTIRY